MRLKDLQQNFLLNLIDQQKTFSLNEKKTTIYRNNIHLRLTKTLKNTYPICHKLVGESFFHGMAQHYIALPTSASTSTSLNDYGADFSTFISTFSPAEPLPYLEDIAKLEWNIHKILNGKDNSTLDTNALAKIKPKSRNTLVFQLIENNALISSSFPIHKIWGSNQIDFQGNDIIDLSLGGCYLFIWRQEYDLRIDTLTKTEWDLLNLIKSEASIERLCEYHSPNKEKEIPDIIYLLPIFIKRGYIGNFI